jgi:hypothetical protein
MQLQLALEYTTESIFCCHTITESTNLSDGQDIATLLRIWAWVAETVLVAVSRQTNRASIIRQCRN